MTQRADTTRAAKKDEPGPATRVAFFLDKEEYRQIKIAAVTQDTSVSEVLRRACRDYVKKHRR